MMAFFFLLPGVTHYGEDGESFKFIRSLYEEIVLYSQQRCQSWSHITVTVCHRAGEVSNLIERGQKRI